jgi:hypothetical protein
MTVLRVFEFQLAHFGSGKAPTFSAVDIANFESCRRYCGLISQIEQDVLHMNLDAVNVCFLSEIQEGASVSNFGAASRAGLPALRVSHDCARWISSSALKQVKYRTALPLEGLVMPRTRRQTIAGAIVEEPWHHLNVAVS